MFPLKTLVVAAIIAIAFGPRVNACPAHNHMQTVVAPAAAEEQAVAVAPAAEVSDPVATPAAEPAEVAVAGQPESPAAN
ncbi:MAG: hypothetical protein KJZ80_05870 [Hyphomicrobiaceae bacterium]|nr:hypothetical protein [Hyphomicrobiaceae bacterium]